MNKSREHRRRVAFGIHRSHDVETCHVSCVRVHVMQPFEGGACRIVSHHIKPRNYCGTAVLLHDRIPWSSSGRRPSLSRCAVTTEDPMHLLPALQTTRIGCTLQPEACSSTPLPKPCHYRVAKCRHRCGACLQLLSSCCQAQQWQSSGSLKWALDLAAGATTSCAMQLVHSATLSED